MLTLKLLTNSLYYDEFLSLKRMLKKYEDGFEKEFGFKPSHADKMANPDTKKMCAMLGKLRKQLKCKFYTMNMLISLVIAFLLFKLLDSY